MPSAVGERTPVLLLEISCPRGGRRETGHLRKKLQIGLLGILKNDFIYLVGNVCSQGQRYSCQLGEPLMYLAEGHTALGGSAGPRTPVPPRAAELYLCAGLRWSMRARGCWASCSGQPGPRGKPRTGRVCRLLSALWPQPDWRCLSCGECGWPGQGRESPTPLGLTCVQQIAWTVMQFCPVSLRTVWGPGPGQFWRGNRVRATEAEKIVGLSRLCGARNTSPWDLRTQTDHT